MGGRKERGGGRYIEARRDKTRLLSFSPSVRSFPASQTDTDSPNSETEEKEENNKLSESLVTLRLLSSLLFPSFS